MVNKEYVIQEDYEIESRVDGKKFILTSNNKKNESIEHYENRIGKNKLPTKFHDNLTLSLNQMVKKIDEYNTHIALGTWFVTLSKYFDDIVEIKSIPYNKPLGFSLIIIQDSRSGKNTIVNLIKNIMNRLNVSNVSTSSFTQNAIIGQADVNAIDFNNKLRLKIKKDPEKYSEADLKEEYKKGYMETKDIIIFDEAKNIFVGGHKDNLTIFIQEILDDKPTISIATGTGGQWERPANCSFILTTIPLNEKSESVIDDGFFQRFAIFKRKLDKDEQKKRRKIYLESYKTDNLMGENIMNDFYDEISDEVKSIKSYIKSTIYNMDENNPKIVIRKDKETGSINKKIQISLRSDGYNKIEMYIDGFIKMVEKKFFGDIVDRIDKFVQVLQLLYIKVGGISMLLRKDKNFEIDTFDIITAHETVVKRTMSGIIDLISNMGKKENTKNINFSRAIGQNWISIELAIKKIASVGKMNYYNSKKKIEELINKKYIDENIDENTKEVSIRCSDKIFQILLFDDDLEQYNEEKSKSKRLFNKDIQSKFISKYLLYLENNGISITNSLFQHFDTLFNLSNNYHNQIKKLQRNNVITKVEGDIRILNEAKKYIGENSKEDIELFEMLSLMIDIVKKNHQIYLDETKQYDGRDENQRYEIDNIYESTRNALIKVFQFKYDDGIFKKSKRLKDLFPNHNKDLIK